MATKGNTGTPTGVSTFDNHTRRTILSAMALTSVINSVSAYLVGGATHRLALYASASGVDTDGMTLVADLGSVTPGANGLVTINTTGSPVINAGLFPVVAVKAGTAAQLYQEFVDTLPDGDVVATRREYFFDDSGNPANAFESVARADTNEDLPARTMRVQIDFTAGSDTTAPSITAGLSVANLALTGFDVLSTWDENCTVSLLVTPVSQTVAPLDTEFDASPEKATATAGAQVSIHHNG